MPPFKKELSRNFSRNASGLLTRVGHGRLLVIGDASLDIPDSAEPMYYLGNKQGDLSAAAAFTELSAACPVDTEVPVRFMRPDIGSVEDSLAPNRNVNVIRDLGFTGLGLLKDGKGGFYEFARGTDPAKPPLYLLTASEDSYDCLVVTIGHSQI